MGKGRYMHMCLLSQLLDSCMVSGDIDTYLFEDAPDSRLPTHTPMTLVPQLLKGIPLFLNSSHKSPRITPCWPCRLCALPKPTQSSPGVLMLFGYTGVLSPSLESQARPPCPPDSSGWREEQSWLPQGTQSTFNQRKRKDSWAGKTAGVGSVHYVLMFTHLNIFLCANERGPMNDLCPVKIPSPHRRIIIMYHTFIISLQPFVYTTNRGIVHGDWIWVQ